MLNPIMLETGVKLRQEQIREALKERNPPLYRQLKKAGRLRRFVKEREQEMYQVFRQTHNRLLDEALRDKNKPANAVEFAKKLDGKLRQAWEEIQATYLEF